METILEIVNFNNYCFNKNYSTFLHQNKYNNNLIVSSQYRNSKLLCCDTTASSFPLKIVEKILKKIYKYYSNTHSNNILGRIMCMFIDNSKEIIMKSVNANKNNDKIIFAGFGTSGAINHLVHLIKPILENCIIFVTIYEHYSNYLPWYHYAKKIIIIDSNENGNIEFDKFENLLKTTKEKIIVSITACSNVTGYIQDVNKMAQITHKYDGYIFIDYATSAPYVPINMHYDDENKIYLDGIFISPHKFPGGQSTPGILIFNEKIICNTITYTPSGGTVDYFSSNIGPVYSRNIEKKENGGTPNILGIIKCGIVFQIKDQFIENIYKHELELTETFQKYLIKLQKTNKNLIVINNLQNKNSLPIFSFQIIPHHYNYIVVLLCDLFGITTRGGLNCSTILAEKILKLNKNEIIHNDEIAQSHKKLPNNYGWVRITLNNTHTHNDIKYIINAINYICKKADKYKSDYFYDETNNVYFCNKCENKICTTLI
jgi:selenocysteine lyase/cysteine desulfurase